MPNPSSQTFIAQAQFDCAITGKYRELLDSTLRTPERAYLFNYYIDDLVRMRATIVAGGDSVQQKIRGGFFHVRQGDGTTFYIGGVASDRDRRKLGEMTHLLGRRMLALAEQHGCPIAFELDVRVIDGTPNASAFRLFSRLGFRPVGPPAKVRICGNHLDRHLIDSSEDGVHFFALKMRADERALYRVRFLLEGRGGAG